MGKHEHNESEFIDIYSSEKPSKKARKASKKKSKKTRTQKAIIAILSTVVAFCVLVAGTLIFALNYFKYNKTEVDENELAVDIEDSEEHIKNIALFGIDTRKDNSMKGLSDSIMVMSIDTQNKTIKLISIMRDSVVDVDGKITKINAAYSKGGPQLAIKTINQNFGLDITDYATVNFGGMAKLIDIVGGVEVEVTKGEINDKYYGINAAIGEQCQVLGIMDKYNSLLVKTPGKQILNGVQAVAWARIRHQPTATGERDDYGRTARQRHVLNELFKRAANMSLLKYPSFIKAMLPHVETSLSYNEIIKLAPVIKGGSLEGTRIPYDNCVIGSGSGVAGGVYYNITYASELMKAYIYDNITFDAYIAEHPIDKTPWVK